MQSGAATRDRGFNAYLRLHRSAFAIAVAWRVLFIALLSPFDATGDEPGYLRIAHNLAEQGRFSLESQAPFEPTTMRAPLLPFLAAVMQSTFGAIEGPLRLFHGLLGLLAIAMLGYAVSRQSARAGTIATWLLCVSPLDALYEPRVLSETLTITLLASAMAAPIVVTRHWRWIVSGISVGLLCLTRDVYLLFVPVLAGWLLMFDVRSGERERSWPHSLRAAAIFTVSAALTIAPWSLRNCLATPVCAPVSKGLLGFNLWVGTWELDPEWTKNDYALPDHAFRSVEEKAQVEEWRQVGLNLETDPRFRDLAIGRIVAAPLQWVRTCVVRFPRLWVGTRTELSSFDAQWLPPTSLQLKAFKVSTLMFNLAALLCGSIGLLLALKKVPWARWWGLPVVYTAAVYFPMHNTEPRYSQPVFQLVLCLAAVAAAAAIDKVSELSAAGRAGASTV